MVYRLMAQFGLAGEPADAGAPRFYAAPAVVSANRVLREARDFVRDGLIAYRQGSRFTESRQYGVAWVSIDGPWVRVTLNHESRGLQIEEAAAVAGVGGNPVSVPPPRVIRPVLPSPIEGLPHEDLVGRLGGDR